MIDVDYVIVGAGTAGCVLAARLSQDPDTRVALVEAGPAEGPARMSDPAASFTLCGSQVDLGIFDHAPGGHVRRYSSLSAGTSTRRVERH
ncbi:NAD(P)-binding protein [Mycobacterium simiae]|uniref:NAD(P)-binding protein n=1 Tax=Mycobacterium simiae TaxID=1784 RepID=UPI000405D3F6|nr:hypothetical protein MSIM_03050 [Mycobacterium simiae]